MNFLAKDHLVFQGVTSCYKVLQSVTTCYKVVQGVLSIQRKHVTLYHQRCKRNNILVQRFGRIQIIFAFPLWPSTNANLIRIVIKTQYKYEYYSDFKTKYEYENILFENISQIRIYLVWKYQQIRTFIPDNCQSRQSRRECKIFQVRGIFPYWTRKGPCVILHTVFSLHTFYSFTQCV